MSVAMPNDVTAEKKYLKIERKFVPLGTDPFSTVEWKMVDAVIINSKGKEVFRQNQIEVPANWSETTINVVADKYFRVVNGVKETSARQMFRRVANWLAYQGVKAGIFERDIVPSGIKLFSSTDAEAFYDELIYMGLHGMHAFNSPVWFNVGVKEEPQCSACFIQSASDRMTDIMDLAKREVMLFKGGSGTGSNLSPLRSSYEGLSTGGVASGPVSFMGGFDAFAGITKSGGGTRRAAKMVILNIDHPDILTLADGRPGFITCKSDAEQLAHDLYSTGKYTAEFNVPGNVYERAHFQNANNSVRVTDDFMEAVVQDKDWTTKAVKSGKVVHTYKARELWKEIAKAAWLCGDPGLQFDTTTNNWHTTPNSGRINASNPCSEYLYLDDTACNLSSLNLLSFLVDGEFAVDNFAHAVKIAIIAKEIIVGASSYPSELIKENSHKYRTLGLGFANLGALLVTMGLPYDSDEGRLIASAVSSLMGGVAYVTSATLACILGPFEAYEENSAEMLKVVNNHKIAAYRLFGNRAATNELCDAAITAWELAFDKGGLWGYRNAQATVIAPTGTIAFLMGCDTTGIESMLGVVTYKKLVGGGFMKLPNKLVKPALKNLKYSDIEIARILQHIEDTGDIHTAKDFKDDLHGKVFAEALGEYALSPEAHINMMAAVQPFISGGISKTVNLPNSATVEDIENVYMHAWKAGIKCVAVFRDGCKLSQPISTSITADTDKKEKGLEWGARKRLQDTCKSIRHKFNVGGQEGYIHVGVYDDGSPGELFVDIAKAGSTLNGLVDAWATNVSIGLQYGVPFSVLREKHIDMRFEPSGFTSHDTIKMAKSIPDYIFRWLEHEFYSKPKEIDQAHVEYAEKVKWPKEMLDTALGKKTGHDGPPCMKCGDMTARSGSCYVCKSCGTTTGCS